MILTSIILIIIALYIFSETPYKIAAIVLIAFAMHLTAKYYKLTNIRDSTQMTNWTRVNALKMYDTVVEKHGLPILNINKQNGLAIWNKTSKNQLIYDEIIIRDEEIINSDIQMSSYSLYLYIKMYIPPDKLNDILKMDIRLSYNKPKFTLCIFTNTLDNDKLILNILRKIHPQIKKLNDIPKFINYNQEINKLQMKSTYYLIQTPETIK